MWGSVLSMVSDVPWESWNVSPTGNRGYDLPRDVQVKEQSSVQELAAATSSPDPLSAQLGDDGRVALFHWLQFPDPDNEDRSFGGISHISYCSLKQQKCLPPLVPKARSLKLVLLGQNHSANKAILSLQALGESCSLPLSGSRGCRHSLACGHIAPVSASVVAAPSLLFPQAPSNKNLPLVRTFRACLLIHGTLPISRLFTYLCKAFAI